MASINNVIISGRLTKDIELKMTQSNKKVTMFTLAVQRTKEVADFITCQAWEKTAEILYQYVKKGDLLNIQGSIRTTNYNTSENRKVYQTYVLVNQIQLLASKRTDTQATEPVEQEIDNIDNIDVDDYDLPF